MTSYNKAGRLEEYGTPRRRGLTRTETGRIYEFEI